MLAIAGSSQRAWIEWACGVTVRRHIERRTGRLPSDGEALDAMLEHAFEPCAFSPRLCALGLGALAPRRRSRSHPARIGRRISRRSR
ncbi:MAG: hypothetical protein ACYTGC_17015, partial [Planctomycetota bacterium]